MTPTRESPGITSRSSWSFLPTNILTESQHESRHVAAGREMLSASPSSTGSSVAPITISGTVWYFTGAHNSGG